MGHMVSRFSMIAEFKLDFWEVLQPWFSMNYSFCSMGTIYKDNILPKNVGSKERGTRIVDWGDKRASYRNKKREWCPDFGPQSIYISKVSSDKGSIQRC